MSKKSNRVKLLPQQKRLLDQLVDDAIFEYTSVIDTGSDSNQKAHEVPAFFWRDPDSMDQRLREVCYGSGLPLNQAEVAYLRFMDLLTRINREWLMVIQVHFRRPDRIQTVEETEIVARGSINDHLTTNAKSSLVERTLAEAPAADRVLGFRLYATVNNKGGDQALEFVRSRQTKDNLQQFLEIATEAAGSRPTGAIVVEDSTMSANTR